MKAIVLISGGLDSILAIKLVQNLGIELVCLNIESPFYHCNHRVSSGSLYGPALVARNFGLRLISINASEEFLEIVNNPKHGYGSNMNPCIDCRILLFKKAKDAMQKEGASFIVTGEVLDQRPMSQKLNTMKLIDREAGLEGLVLRPLSAKLLEPTIPEEKSWVARDKLFAISGRGRREQIFLAKELGIDNYPWPGGGCLLTDPEFSRRLKDLMKYRLFNTEEIQLLKLGRHFRLSETAKLVVGRNEKENGCLFNLAKEGNYLFSPGSGLRGPVALGRGIFNTDLIKISSSIICRYCDLNGRTEADMTCAKVIKKETASFAYDPLTLKTRPLEETKLVSLRI